MLKSDIGNGQLMGQKEKHHKIQNFARNTDAVHLAT